MTYISEAYYAPGHSQASRKFSQEKPIHLMVFVLDLLTLMAAYQLSMLLLSFSPAFFGEGQPGNGLPAQEMRHIIYSFLSLGVLFFLFLNGHYTRRMPWWSQFQHICKIIFFIVLTDGFVSYAFDLQYSQLFIASNWAAAFSMIIFTRLGINIVKSRSNKWKLPAVIIADPNTATDTLYALASDNGMGLAARTIFLRNKSSDSVDREELPLIYRNIDILRGQDDYEDFILNHPDNFYIVSLEEIPVSQRDRLIKLFQRAGIRFALLPAISRTSIYQAEPHYFFGNDVMLLDSRKPAASLFGQFLKRGMDIAGASVALAIFIVPMLAVALMLKLEGQGGSPLYAGKRVGQNGRLFRCWKFRTMEPGTDHLLYEYLNRNPAAKTHWDRYFKLPDDPRVQTKTARFIRKASIDELPQLWNVLRGEMSLVGPRPILESEIQAYGDRIDEYTSVKPGITGLWQASGRNGTSFQRRIAWDSWYVRNWTLWGDIIIILKTVQAVLNKSGAS